MRQSGLDVVGRVPWGSHFCQFYQTKQDLLDVLVPYFRQGLASNEYCMWVTSEPLGVDEAWQALRAREPGLERAAQMGQIEILDYHDWYLRGGTFQAHEVLAGWIERLQAARDRGFDGLRLTGNTFWLEKKDWKDFVEYEESINKVIGRYPIIALCTYCLDRCGIDEVMDVLVHHQFALIKRQGRWQLIRSAEHEHLTRKLLENEERFRLAVKATRDAIWDLDLSTGTVQWNDTYAELFGRPPESGGSWQWWIDHIHPEDRERTVSGIREAITGRASTWVGEYRFQRPDGSWADVHDRAYIARDEAGKAWRVVGAMLDDTHRKAAERQLSESERHHRLLFETMLQGVVYQDAAGRIISMNPAAERILGKSPEDFLGRTSEDEEHHTLREDGTPFPGLEHPAMVALRTGRELRDVVMGVFNPRDPGYRWISISAVPLFREGEDTPYQVYTLFNDITAHRQAEQALQLSEARYRTLFDGMTEGYALHEIVLDEHGQPADSRFLEINPAFERLTGLKRKDVVGRLRSEVLPGEDPEWVAIYADVALTGRPAHFENYSIVIGKYYEVLASRPAPGQIAVLFVDVTDRRQAEQELARLNQELQRRIVELETILDTVPIGIGIAEDPECRKIRGNAALAEMLGQPPGANLSKSAPGGDAPANFRTMKDGRELPADQLPMQVAAAKGIPVFNADFDLVHDNGRLLRFFGNATPLFDEEGRTRGSIGAFWDISPLKAAQEVLEKSHDELERKVQQRTEQLRRTIQVLRMVSGCNHALVHAGDEQQLIEEICRVIHDVGGYHMVWVGYAENDPDRTIRPVASIGPEDSYLQRVRITWGDDELGRGPTGTGWTRRTQTPTGARTWITTMAAATRPIGAWT